eukprot:3596119-Lingulodinium_polyedra.AAC.1
MDEQSAHCRDAILTKEIDARSCSCLQDMSPPKERATAPDFRTCPHPRNVPWPRPSIHAPTQETCH